MLNYFDFDERPRPPEVPPAAPPATLNLQVAGPNSIYYTAPLGRPVEITLAAETPGLTPDIALSGLVSLSVEGPAGTPHADVPPIALLKGGAGWFDARFPADGYWRVKAVGPERSLGWVTVGVAVDANTP